MPPLGRAGCAALLAVLGACAGESGEAGLETLRQVGAGATTAQAGALGVRVESVTPNGTGCPAGTAHVELDPDGEHFTVKFDAYEAAVTPESMVSIKDCLLAIKINAPSDVSYAVESFDFGGRLTLEDGVKAKMTSNYYFQGDPASGGKELATELVGPVDDTFRFTDKLSASDAVWSECGKQRDLNLVTRLRVQNSSPARAGRIVMSEARSLRIAARRCGDSGEPVVDGGAPSIDGGTAPALDSGLDVDVPDAETDAGPATQLPGPDGAFFASVRALGTGCPAGTTNTSIAADGKTFTTTFAAFEAKVDENTSVAIKDCQLGVTLKSPTGLSFAVTDFSYQGYAYLEAGQTARQIARYYFQGSPVQSEETRTDLVGPFDDSYTFQDTVKTTDLVWSPCGLERDLNIRSTLRLQNATPKKNGYINLEKALMLKLAWRKCE